MICDNSTGDTSQGSGTSPVSSYMDFRSHLLAAGFIVEDDDARLLYETYGYHRIAPYVAFLMRSSAEAGTARRTADLVALIDFNHKVQALLLYGIGVIEAQVKCQYAQAMTAAFGPNCLDDALLFKRPSEHRRLVASVRHETRRHLKGRNGRVAFDEGFPIGAYLEYASLGTVTRLLSITKDSTVLADVAKAFSANKRCLLSWLRTLSSVRNSCAHFNPFAVRAQIPAVPKPVYGHEGDDNTSPLYALLLVERLLHGRVSAGIPRAEIYYEDFFAKGRDVFDEPLFALGAWACALRVPSLFRRSMGTPCFSLGSGCHMAEYATVFLAA